MESQDHIFWRCEPAIWVWDFIADWWSNKSLHSRVHSFSLVHVLKLYKQRHIVLVWKMVVAATLWTLWLARNEHVFNNRKLKAADLKQLLLIRVAKWGSATNILNVGFSPDWKLNPIGVLSAIHFRKSNLFWNFLKEAYDYICMVDGAWNKRFDGTVGGGIGGKLFTIQARLY